jgi:hypothetical protein
MKENEIISKMKASEEYRSFTGILQNKKDHELQAKNILEGKQGDLNYEDLRDIITLVDFPYMSGCNLKNGSGPWFGRLLRFNTKILFETDLNEINRLFAVLMDDSSIYLKFDLILNDPHRIKGLNTGFITLMLYLLDKNSSLVWFEAIHNGFLKLFPENNRYRGKPDQYLSFVEKANAFAKKYGFEPTELDWIFSTGVFLLFN